MIKIHKEAYPTLFFAVAIYLLFNLGMWRLFHEFPIIYNILFAITSVLLLIIILFFRVKTRVEPVSNSVVLSPAYGTVVNIDKVYENQYFQDERLIVSIFMSPLNIHCNYVPINGIVQHAQYNEGKYLMAFHPKSSEENEHATYVIENEKMAVMVKQIAGFMARRIVPYLEKGDIVEQNDELGFIKFGSRVDVFFPLNTEIRVKVGEKVKGAITILADLQA